MGMEKLLAANPDVQNMRKILRCMQIEEKQLHIWSEDTESFLPIQEKRSERKGAHREDYRGRRTSVFRSINERIFQAIGRIEIGCGLHGGAKDKEEEEWRIAVLS